MLEIIILYKLCMRIGDAARGKGRQAIGYQLMLILFWLGGELGTAFFAILALPLLFGEEYEQYIFVGYIAAILGAAFGAWLAFRIVAGLPENRSLEVPESEAESSSNDNFS
ncbi:MAG: hypothetical protein R3B84_16185 [Zavarzinella sp.]